MKLPKGRVLGKFAGKGGVIYEVLGQVPPGLNGYIRVVGAEPSGQVGVILIEGGQPVGALVAGGRQSFGRASLSSLMDLAAAETAQVRLIGFYEESMAEVEQTSENMKRVAPVSRADFESLRSAPPPKPGGPAAPPATRPPSNATARELQAVAESVKAPGPKPQPKGIKDEGFFKELLEAGVKAAREESKAAGEDIDPDLAAKLEDYLTKSNLHLDDALSTFATVIAPKPTVPPGPDEARLPPALKEEISTAEAQLERTAKRYEYLLTKDMASAKALRDQEESLTKMEGQLRDLKETVQGEGEKRLKQLETASARASGAEAAKVLQKLREEQEAIYARVEKLVQMENLFKQNLLTQRKRIDQKEQELQQLASQLKSDFLERKRLLDEEKESYLEDLRRQSKELKTREAMAVEREKRANELAARLEGEMQQKIHEIEARRHELEAHESRLRSQAEALALKESEAARQGASKSQAANESRAEMARQRGELAREREEYAGRIALLSKREEELRSLEVRLNERRAAIDDSEKARMLRQIDDEELRNIVGYLDRLLEALPADRISDFAASEYYQLYIKLLERLGI